MKKIVAYAISLCFFVVIFNVDSIEAIQFLRIGDYVQFGTYNSKPVIWRIVNFDEEGDPLLFTDKVISFKPYNSVFELGSKDATNRNSSGYWPETNLRQWLNSDETKINWVYGRPSAPSFYENYNAYADEKGFLADGNFTSLERAAIKTVTIKSTLNSFWVGRPRSVPVTN